MRSAYGPMGEGESHSRMLQHNGKVILHSVEHTQVEIASSRRADQRARSALEKIAKIAMQQSMHAMNANTALVV